MNNKLSKHIFPFIAIFTFVLLCGSSFAANYTVPPGMKIEDYAKQQMDMWINAKMNSNNLMVQRYKGSNDYYYALDLGNDSVASLSSYGFTYDSPTKISFSAQNSNGVMETCYIELTASADVYYDYVDKADNKTYSGSVTLTSSEMSNAGDKILMQFPSILKANHTKDINLTVGNSKVDIPDATMLYIGSTKTEVPMDYLFQNEKTNARISYKITGTNLTGGSKSFVTVENVNGETIWDKILAFLKDIANWVLDVLQKILNKVALLIADGLKILIDSAIGEKLTIQKIVYGETERFSINLWDNTLPANSIGAKLKDIVNTWFNYFRGLGIAVYLIMLLYAGVRILLSSTGRGTDVAKEKLANWAVGIVILFVGPIVMHYVVEINDAVIEIVKNESGNIRTTSGKDMMEVVRDNAESQGLIVLTIIYFIMLGQLLVLIGVYYKRAFMFAFLIVIFPIVATYYIWEKTHKGGARALQSWTKEFVVIVFTQLIHAVVYSVLIEGMYDALIGKGEGNYILYILCVTFLFKAEGIVKQIFNVRSTAGTIGDMAASGAAAFAITKSITGVFSKTGGNSDIDAKEADDSTRQVNALKQANQADAYRKQIESEENENNRKYRAATGIDDSEESTTTSTTPTVTPESLATSSAEATSSSEVSSTSIPGGVTGGMPVVSAETVSGTGADAVVGINMYGPYVPRTAPSTTRSSTSENQKRIRKANEMSDLEKARLVYRQKALQAKRKGKVRRIANFAVRNVGRAAGIVTGLAMGAAQGDMSKAIQHATNLGMIGARLGKGLTKITDAGVGRFSGARLRLKAERNDYENDLKAVGVSDEFIDQVYNNAKGEAIRKALAKEISGTRRGGVPLGDVKFTGTMEHETGRTVR